MPTYYILLRDQTASEKNGYLDQSYKTSKRTVQVLKGSLWKCENTFQDNTIPHSGHQKWLYLQSIDTKEAQFLDCSDNEVSRLTEEQCALLTPINTCGDRYKVFQDKSWLSEAIQIKAGTVVYILKFQNTNEKAVGKVRYKGAVPGSSGIYFGVELSVEYVGKGTTDGVFRNQRYFQCEQESGVFVNISKLRLCPKNELFKSRNMQESPVNSPVEHEFNFDDRSLSPPPLEIGERVVWIGDHGPHYGTVHWLGILDDSREREWTVGVEFDDPVGTGTGKYQETQLFKARAKHASLIPLIGLIKASEFGADPHENGVRYHSNNNFFEDPSMKRHGYDNHMRDFTTGTIAREHQDHTLKSTYGTGKDKTGKTKGPVLNEAYYRQSYRTDKSATPELPPKSRRTPEEKSFYEEIGDKQYINTHAHGMSRASSTHENFLDDPNYARVQDWQQNVRPGAPSTSSQSPLSQQMSPPSALRFPPITTSSVISPNNHSETTYAQVHSRRDPETNSYMGDKYKTGSFPNTSPPAYNELSFPSAPVSEDTLDSKEQGVYSRTRSRVSPTGASGNSQQQRFLSSDSDIVRQKTLSSQRQQNRPSMHEDSSSHSTYRHSDHSNNSGTVEKPKASGVVTLDPKTLPGDLDLGTMVEVIDNPANCRYGVIRWVGYLQDKKNPIVGLEMEEENPACTYGSFGGQKVFELPVKKAFFVYLHKIKKDSRFDESESLLTRTESLAFGSLESPDVQEITPPPGTVTRIEQYLGKQRGIQGHHNSCYLDATLMSMFAFTSVFDSLLLRQPGDDDIKEFKDVQIIMREGIVYPLRKNFYVRADKVLKLRTLLDKVTNLRGLMTEEKDPEEFLTCLFQSVLKAQPFLKLNSNQESYLYQLFVEKDEKLILPTTEQLLELSFYQGNIKLKEVPTCLIIQMPRFGKEYKMYRKILPSLELDVTDLLEYGPRECHLCGKLATYECKDCFEFGTLDSGLQKCAFCDACVKQYHQHSKRHKHIFKPMEKNKEYEQYVQIMQKAGHQLTQEPLPREKMELFAVICIETSHYVSFVKCGRGLNAPWVFFDSMADRMGAENGYNIPEVKPCPFLPDLLLKKEEYYRLLDMKDDKSMDPYKRRLLCDAYICMYQSPDLQMYT